MVSIFLLTYMFSGYMSVSCPGETGELSSTVTDDLIGLAAETGNRAASAAANAGKTAAITQTANSKEADLLLHYDDRYIFEEEIDYIETVSVDSFAVGTESPDEFVLVQDSSGRGKVTARGCGRAEVYLKNGENCTVRVEPAAISLVLFAGQSNGEGRPMDISRLEEYKQQWVICEEGQVYSSYAPSDEYGQDMYHEVAWYEDTEGIGALSEENAGRFIPYSLGGNENNDIYCRTDRLTGAEGTSGKGGPDSAFAWRWNKLTGEKIWIINACHHGSNIQSWDPEHKRNRNFREAATLIREAFTVMGRECRAGHYLLQHKGVIWCQGENNRETKAGAYMKALLRVRDGLFSAMEYESENGKTGLAQQPDFFGILMVRAAAADPLSLEDFQLNGPRTAQYMAAALSTGKFRDIYLASQVEELWSSDASVSRYFYEKYGSEEEFQEAYPTYSQWMPMPDEVRDLHGGIHFSQIADNEIGMDAAENICCVLGLIDPGAVENPGIEFLTESGVQPGNSIIIPAEIEKPLFAVRVFPAYMTGKLELSYTDNIRIKNGIPKRIGPGEIIIRAWLPENRE